MFITIILWSIPIMYSDWKSIIVDARSIDFFLFDPSHPKSVLISGGGQYLKPFGMIENVAAPNEISDYLRVRRDLSLFISRTMSIYFCVVAATVRALWFVQ